MFVKHVATCSDGCKLSIEFAKPNNQQSTSNVLILPVTAFEEPLQIRIGTLPLFSMISSKIEHVIGTLGRRLLFLDRRMWVCSLDLERFSGEYYRHFLIPEDWLSVNRNLILNVTAKGDFVFVKKDEIAVIKQGLENREAVNIGT